MSLCIDRVNLSTIMRLLRRIEGRIWEEEFGELTGSRE